MRQRTSRRLRTSAAILAMAAATVTGLATWTDEPRAAESETGVRVDTVDLDDPIASASAPSPTGRGTITVDLLSLERRGRLAELRLAYRIDESDDDSPNPYGMADGRAPSPQLIDLEALVRHQPVADENGRELEADPVFNRAPVGEPVVAYYVFAAPESDVVDVRVWDFLAPFENVPVTDA